MARSSIKGKLIAAALSTVLCLALAEIVLRTLDLPTSGDLQFLGFGEGSTFRTDPELLWCLRADAEGLEVNRLGLRGRLPTGPAAARDYRIACVGDSSTFGIHLPYHQAWGVRFEQLLQRELPNRAVVSMLAALPGYSTEQNRRLLDRHIADLGPALTVLYVGAWNDLVAAVGTADADHGRGLRLPQLFRSSPDAGSVKAAFMARDEAPFGRRVPVPDFVANVRAMIQRARGVGSDVVAILPPVPLATQTKWPSVTRYRQALEAVLLELKTPYIDGSALLQGAEAELPQRHAQPPGQASACYQDWIHPSAYGHELLARGLVALLKREGLLRQRPPAETRPLATELSPASLPGLAGGTLTISGRDLASVTRINIADHTLTPTLLSDGRIAIVLPIPVPAGNYAVELLGPFGLVAADETLHITAAEATATTRTIGEEIEVLVSGDAPPNWTVIVWFSSQRAAVATPTKFGPFALPGAEHAQADGLPELPFRFDLLRLPMTSTVATAEGRYEVRQRMPKQQLATTERIAIQAGMFDAANPLQAVFSAVAETNQPR